ncbi:unnamed protein product, partial [marine sediment metagenome]
LVTYFGQDSDTEVIVLYVEGLEQPQAAYQGCPAGDQAKANRGV